MPEGRSCPTVSQAAGVRAGEPLPFHPHCCPWTFHVPKMHWEAINSL